MGNDKIKILYVIGNYGKSQIKYLKKIIEEIKSWSADVDMVVNTDIPLNLGVKENIVTCPPLEILLTTKQTIFDNKGEYDLYIYSENDILITWRNIESWLGCRKEVELPYMVGFIRYEQYDNKWYPDCHGFYKWGEVISRGDYILRYFSNLHQGSYVLDNELLNHVINNPVIPWLNGNHPSETPNIEQHYGLLERANTDIFKTGIRVIPISHLEDFSIWHMPNKYKNIIGTTSI
jgi:hypothetical protein